MDKFEENTIRKQELLKRLHDIRALRTSNRDKKKTEEYRQMATEQMLIEQELASIKTWFSDATREERHKANMAFLASKTTKLIVRPKIVPVYVDDYTGERCEYCGGKVNDRLCTNSSAEWPHVPNVALSNVQSTVSTESVSI
jgi:hypothetical protein